MNDNILRIRLPSSLADRLKQRASEFGRTASDVAREGMILNLRRLEAQTFTPANSNDEPPQAA